MRHILKTYGEMEIKLQAFNLDNRYRSDVSFKLWRPHPKRKHPRRQLDWRLGATLSRSRFIGEKKLCSYPSRIRIPRSSIRQCTHYTNLATQAPMQHTYDSLKPNTTDCVVGNTWQHWPLHTEVDRLRSQPNHTISSMSISSGPLSHSTQIHGTVPPLDHERFLQNYLHILSNTDRGDFSPKHPDRLQGPPSHLFNGCPIFPRV